MVERLFEILDRKSETLEPSDIELLVQLAEKYPEFKVLNALLRKYPADIFNIEPWNKAEINHLNLTELLQSYEEKTKPHKIDKTKSEQTLVFKDKSDKIAFQNEILLKFLNKKKS